MSLYIDLEGKYRLIDFQQGHNELLLRKHKDSTFDYNIDILFKGVYSLNITILYKGINILKVDRGINQTCNNLADRNFIFKIIDREGLVSFIDAAAFGVFKNQLDYGSTSLGDFTWSKENELVFWENSSI